MTLLWPQSADALYVLTPIVLAVSVCAFFVIILWRKDGDFPIVDIGLFAVLFTTVYTVIPLLGFYLGGLKFGLLSDGRLQTYNPPPRELGLFFAHHIAYLASLVSSYLLLRRPNPVASRRALIHPSRSLTQILLIGFVFLTLYFVLLNSLFEIGFRSGYNDRAQLEAGPLWLQQLNGKLSGVRELFLAAILALMVLRKIDFGYRFLLFAVIVWEIATAFVYPGSRGELFSLLIFVILFWHKFHGISFRFLQVALPVAFLAFMFLGVYRSFNDIGDLLVVLDSFEVIASASNEFQAVFGTGFDVHEMMERGSEVPSILFFNDFIPLLPPQQLLSIPKLTGAEWYLIQIGQNETGVGFMWSVISQSLVGFGMVELIVRGLVLGSLLAYIHRWYQRRYNRFLPVVVYVVLCLNTVWTFRDTTGAIVWLIWWSVFPFVLFFYFLGFRSVLSRDSSTGTRFARRASIVQVR